MNTVEKQDYSNMSVGKIVARDYRKAMVFKSYGIDFCCGGAIKLKDVAEEYKVNYDELLGALHEVDLKNNDEPTNYNEWPLNKLVDHIVNKHHNYVRETVTQVTPLMAKLEMVHGQWRPELLEIKALFTELSQELMMHMQKEEMILFPAIKELEAGRENESGACFGTVINPINMMEHEHDIAGDLMKKISSLSDGYTLPKGACATYTVVYKVLNEFQEDLFTHIHLENNILFPRAIELEAN